METQPDKEALIKLLNGTLDGHARNTTRSVHYLDGIKHVRDLLDTTFDETIQSDELMEFCVSIICSIQPEEPRMNRFLSELEQGILAAAYFLYTAMYPLEYHPTASGDRPSGFRRTDVDGPNKS